MIRCSKRIAQWSNLSAIHSGKVEGSKPDACKYCRKSPTVASGLSKSNLDARSASSFSARSVVIPSSLISDPCSMQLKQLKRVWLAFWSAPWTTGCTDFPSINVALALNLAISSVRVRKSKRWGPMNLSRASEYAAASNSRFSSGSGPLCTSRCSRSTRSWIDKNLALSNTAFTSARTSRYRFVFSCLRIRLCSVLRRTSSIFSELRRADLAVVQVPPIPATPKPAVIRRLQSNMSQSNFLVEIDVTTLLELCPR
ncbi:hypothetical protein FB461_1963 [Rarobacter faecitabidus]|uniref:Uncharacterized protein n=1 Tax=Rarobacter faecitabidus TaxID=13243 RepID=A0A542ZDZ5_RARFA|nr:hypothetical protein FB461_1963 [Rarobacter faecitabidus]